MKVFAGLVVYLAALTVLLGGAAIGVAAFLSNPGEADQNAAAKRPQQQLVRAADRKKPAQIDDKTKAATAPAVAATSPAVPQAAPAAIPPQASAAELAKKQARLVKPKKAKPKPRPMPEFDDRTALGFAAPPRSFDPPFFR